MKRLLILLLTGLFAQLVVSCYPEGADNIDDYDVAITNYDKSADFSAFTTFSIPDTIVYFTNDNDIPAPSHEFDQQIIQTVTENFTRLGYKKCPILQREQHQPICPVSLSLYPHFPMSTMLISSTIGITTGIGIGAPGGTVRSAHIIPGIPSVCTNTEPVQSSSKWYLPPNGMITN